MDAVQPVKPFPCDKCDKSYTRKDHLKRHQVVHSDSKFKCDKCGATYARKDKLKIHTDKNHKPTPTSPTPSTVSTPVKTPACMTCGGTQLTRCVNGSYFCQPCEIVRQTTYLTQQMNNMRVSQPPMYHPGMPVPFSNYGNTVSPPTHM